jgi:hypothetical protein
MQFYERLFCSKEPDLTRTHQCAKFQNVLRCLSKLLSAYILATSSRGSVESFEDRLLDLSPG